MTVSQNTQTIIRRRAAGDSVQAIARDLGVSRNCVYLILELLPKKPGSGDGKTSVPDYLDVEMRAKIALSYIQLCPPSKKVQEKGAMHYAREIVPYLAEQYNIPAKDVWAVLFRFRDWHGFVKKTPYYSTIEAWRKRNSIRAADLSRITGVDKQHMAMILSGAEHMPLQVAERISRASGLSLAEIYGDLLPPEAVAEPGPEQEAEPREE